MWRLLIIFAANFLIANPVDDLIGISARVKSMGGAGTVLSEDFSATFYNPANLSHCGKNKISFGYDFIDTNLDVKKQLGAYNQVSLGLCLVPIQNLGMGVYASTGLLNPVDIRSQTATARTQSLLYSDALRFPSMMAGISYRFIPQISIGAAASMHIAGNIGLDMGLPILQILTDLYFSNLLLIKADPVLSFIAGITYEPISSVRTSLVYRSPSYSDMKINADVKINSSLLDTNLKMLLITQLDYSPMQLAFGASYKPLAELTIAGDATYYRWSVFQSPFIQAHVIQNTTPNIRFGANEKLNLRDTISPRVGMEYFFKSGMAIRAGYAYLMTPTLTPTGTSRVFDGDVHRMTMGAGYRWSTSDAFALLLDTFVAIDAMSKGALAGGTVLNTGLTLTAEY